MFLALILLFTNESCRFKGKLRDNVNDSIAYRILRSALSSPFNPPKHTAHSIDFDLLTVLEMIFIAPGAFVLQDLQEPAIQLHIANILAGDRNTLWKTLDI